MRNVTLSVLLTIVALGNAAQAQTPEDCIEWPVIPDGLLSDLTGWIALHSMYDVGELFRSPPKIAFCSVGEWIPYEDTELRVEPELRAAYNHPADTIFLVLPWSAENPYDRSVLLHELIHDVQLANRDWPCVGAPEMEAYLLQSQYLSAYGIDPGFDWASIFRLSICPAEN